MVPTIFNNNNKPIIPCSLNHLQHQTVSIPAIHQESRFIKKDFTGCMAVLGTCHLRRLVSPNLLSRGSLGWMRAYHERVIDHFEKPRNIKSFDKSDPSVGTGLVGAPACGDVMKVQIKVDDVTGIVTDAANRIFGCGAAVASSSVATEWAKGKHIDELASITNRDIAKYLNLPPVKLHCSLLAEEGLSAAALDYKTKRAARNGGDVGASILEVSEP